MAPARAAWSVSSIRLARRPTIAPLRAVFWAPLSGSGGRYAPALGRVHRFCSCAKTARRRARFARTAPRRTSRWPRAALLCVQCAADYAERADTLGCARCGGALRIGVPIEGHDVEGLCAPCAVGVAAAAAAKAAAAPLLLAPGAARRDRGRRRPTEHGRQDHGARQALSGVRLLRRGAGRGVRPVHGSRERGVGDEEGRRLPHCSANVCCLAFTAWRDQRWGSLDELPQPASSLNRNKLKISAVVSSPAQWPVANE